MYPIDELHSVRGDVHLSFRTYYGSEPISLWHGEGEVGATWTLMNMAAYQESILVYTYNRYVP